MDEDRSRKIKEAKKLLEEYQKRRHSPTSSVVSSTEPSRGFVHDLVNSPFLPVKKRNDANENDQSDSQHLVHQEKTSLIMDVQLGAANDNAPVCPVAPEGNVSSSQVENNGDSNSFENYSKVLSVMVNEKAVLQSQLRQYVDYSNVISEEKAQLLHQVQSLVEQLKLKEATAERSVAEANDLQERLGASEERLRAIEEELKRLTRLYEDCRDDAKEARAQLASRDQELSRTKQELRNAKGDLEMKEIALLQYCGGASVANPLQQSANGEVDLLKQELARWQNEVHYLRSANDSNNQRTADTVSQMQSEINRLTKDNLQLVAQLHMAVNSDNNTPAEGNGELAGAKSAIVQLENRCQSQQKLVEQLEAELANKSGQLQQLNSSLAEKADALKNYQQVLEQLHSEKAVSCRALGQNRELKEQLVELEKKFIDMSIANADLASKTKVNDALVSTFASASTQTDGLPVEQVSSVQRDGLVEKVSNDYQPTPKANGAIQTEPTEHLCCQLIEGQEDDPRQQKVTLKIRPEHVDLLQERFIKAMNENANLMDQNQRYEHLIVQLQNETDTIGEFITLYQHQRKVINERLKERENYTAHMCREKEKMKDNVLELEDLISKLVMELNRLRLGNVESYSTAKDNYFNGIDLAYDSKATTASSEEVALNNGEMPLESGTIDGNLVANKSPSCCQEPLSSDSTYLIIERIHHLLKELLQPELFNQLPPVGDRLQCDHCTGKLVTL